MIEPVTLSEAAPWVAKGLGLRWPEDRAEIVDGVNKARNYIFNMKDVSDDIFSDVYHCICVSTFRELCPSTCRTLSTYQGISVPNDTDAVMAAWDSGRPLLVRSRWREAATGQGTHGYPRVELVEMAQRFPTERCLQNECNLKVFAEHDDDQGKIVTVEVVDCNRRTVKLRFTLESNGWQIVNHAVRSIVSVSLPSGLKGSVTLAQENGYELSVYEPWETVPSYKRFKVATRCQSGVVLIQGRRRYRRIWFDSDIVEVGDQLVLEAAGRMFRYGESSTEARDINRSKFDEQTMRDQLLGLISRHRGSAYQDGPVQRRAQATPRKSLPGYNQ